MGNRQERVNKIANRLIREAERKRGEKLSNEEIVKKFQEAEKKEKETRRKERRDKKRENKMKKIKRKIVTILATLGITVGGATALLNSGEEPEQEPVGQETDINEGKDNITPKTEREKYLEELREGVDENSNKAEEKLDNIIDEILEKYNEDLSEQAQIDKDDLGIISQSGESIGQITKNASGEYIKAPIQVDQLEEGQVYVDKEHRGGYCLVNNNNNETVAGIIETEDGYHELRVDYVSIKDANGSETVYTRNPDTYVELEELFNDQIVSGEIDWKTIGDSFENYYEERLSNLTNERNHDGFEH